MTNYLLAVVMKTLPSYFWIKYIIHCLWGANYEINLITLVFKFLPYGCLLPKTGQSYKFLLISNFHLPSIFHKAVIYTC